MPFAVAAEPSAVSVDVEDSRLFRRLLELGLDVPEKESDVEVGVTTSFGFPTREDRPSNVTSAFSLTQDRDAELKRAKMTVSKRGMEKFVCASAIKRGMASPNVTFVYDGEVERVVVVQPFPPDTLHVEPVKPLMQMQEQPLVDVAISEVPPF